MSRHRKLVASLAVVPLLFAACGGSASGPAGGATAASWCDFGVEFDVVDEFFASPGVDPSELQDGMILVESFVQRLTDEAPDEIKEPAKKVAEATQMLIDAFKAADYNVLDIDLGFLENSTLEGELDAASDKLDAYTETNCDSSFSGDAIDDSDDFNLGDGTIREQLVAQFVSIGLANEEAECIADKLDFNDPSVQSGDIGAMLGVFEGCGIGLDRLADLGGG